jgi:homoserine O-acetyltransferase
MKTLKYNQPFTTETGTIFPAIDIAYDTWGKLNSSADNVIWICHALTANSDVESWWPGMVGEGLLFDPGKYFIVCANILGSCYGTTGPASVNPETDKPWLRDFPLITFRDLVNVHEILRNHLGIRGIHSIIGSSIGGYQALEYCIMQPDIIQRLILIASNAKQSPWAIALNESQRLALEADQSFVANDPEGGKKGMKAARSIGLISYRTSTAYNLTQKEDDDEKITSFKASSYQAYQGDKLVKRFNPYSYWSLLQLADTHNVGRGRDGVINALKGIKSKTLCVGIKSDILYPVDEQKFVAANITNAEYVEIDSFYGHDGFLIETKTVTEVIRKFREKTSNLKK